VEASESSYTRRRFDGRWPVLAGVLAAESKSDMVVIDVVREFATRIAVSFWRRDCLGSAKLWS
jgi:hypothetical protein